MLKQLNIQNIAVAENVAVDFDAGLNIITGETGAGKSILVDALALLRGGKVDVGLIRDGAEAASVGAVFSVSPQARALEVLGELGVAGNVDDPREIVLRRVLQRSGKHRAFINDIPVSTRALQALASELIDISSQFDNQRLLESESHTRYLDQFVGALDLAGRFSRNHAAALEAFASIRKLEAEIELRRRELALYGFELKQIDEARLSAEEFERVQATVTLGNKASAARKICSDVAGLLSEGDQNVLSILKVCKRSLERLERLAVGRALPLTQAQVEEAAAHIEALHDGVEATLAVFDIDEEAFALACDRLETYNKILQKFGPALTDVAAYRDRCARYLEQSSDLGAELTRTVEAAAALVADVVANASALSKKRSEGVKALSGCIQKELNELGMPKARFACGLVQDLQEFATGLVPDALAQRLPESVLVSFCALTRSGAERAQFLMSANAGLEPQPIERVASGGELSRTMLAIKSVLFEREAMSVFVFDEIDTGISGAIAAKVGKKLAEFCGERQAICITHLPQVACFAGSHFIVSKGLRKARTVTQIRRATLDDKLKELAGMLSGEKVTPESVAHARALIAEARGALA